ncbi:hypothetical protein BZA77DRAFT_372201 [Pyronema omphalodes]|nr:hypothetical protein BZA77DRAFT_372201 [Pyronema omphalodes]
MLFPHLATLQTHQDRIGRIISLPAWRHELRLRSYHAPPADPAFFNASNDKDNEDTGFIATSRRKKGRRIVDVADSCRLGMKKMNLARKKPMDISAEKIPNTVKRKEVVLGKANGGMEGQKEFQKMGRREPGNSAVALNGYDSNGSSRAAEWDATASKAAEVNASNADRKPNTIVPGVPKDITTATVLRSKKENDEIYIQTGHRKNKHKPTKKKQSRKTNIMALHLQAKYEIPTLLTHNQRLMPQGNMSTVNHEQLERDKMEPAPTATDNYDPSKLKETSKKKVRSRVNYSLAIHHQKQKEINWKSMHLDRRRRREERNNNAIEARTQMRPHFLPRVRNELDLPIVSTGGTQSRNSVSPVQVSAKQHTPHLLQQPGPSCAEKVPTGSIETRTSVVRNVAVLMRQVSVASNKFDPTLEEKNAIYSPQRNPARAFKSPPVSTQTNGSDSQTSMTSLTGEDIASVPSPRDPNPDSVIPKQILSQSEGLPTTNGNMVNIGSLSFLTTQNPNTDTQQRTMPNTAGLQPVPLQEGVLAFQRTDSPGNTVASPSFTILSTESLEHSDTWKTLEDCENSSDSVEVKAEEKKYPAARCRPNTAGVTLQSSSLQPSTAGPATNKTLDKDNVQGIPDEHTDISNDQECEGILIRRESVAKQRKEQEQHLKSNTEQLQEQQSQTDGTDNQEYLEISIQTGLMSTASQSIQAQPMTRRQEQDLRLHFGTASWVDFGNGVPDPLGFQNEIQAGVPRVQAQNSMSHSQNVIPASSLPSEHAPLQRDPGNSMYSISLTDSNGIPGVHTTREPSLLPSEPGPPGPHDLMFSINLDIENGISSPRNVGQSTSAETQPATPGLRAQIVSEPSPAEAETQDSDSDVSIQEQKSGKLFFFGDIENPYLKHIRSGSIMRNLESNAQKEVVNHLQDNTVQDSAYGSPSDGMSEAVSP